MVILGSTGSIGINALEIAKRYCLEVEILGAGYNIELLNAQILQYHPKSVIIADSKDIAKVTPHFKGEIYIGESGILEAIKSAKSNLVINALVGFLGLQPTLFGIKQGKIIALANKESLVVGGHLIDREKIIPIDSEHFSLSYLLNFKNSATRPFKNLYITASGGAFRDTPLHLIPKQSAKEALKHPNWQMGRKITIDSATMVNKLFEILEAYYLFQSKNIDAFIERNSHIHALVEFCDGSITSHFATANMQLPLAYAISLGLKKDFLDSKTPIITPLNFQNISYTLEPICTQRYPLWGLKNTLLDNPKLGLCLNAANEIAIEAFLNNKISFGKLSSLVQLAIHTFKKESFHSLDEILELDKEVRTFTHKNL